MNARFGLIAVLLFAAGCWNFENEFNGRCADGGFTDRCGQSGGGGGGSEVGGGGGGGGGGASGGGGGGGNQPFGGGGGIGPLCRPRVGCTVTTGSWCWESPLPQGNRLLATWTSPDGGVWAAGEGPTLIKYDSRLQSFTNYTHLLNLQPASDPFSPTPSVSGVALTDAGVWLIGPELGLQFSAEGAFTRANDEPWLAIASANDQVFAINALTRNQLQRVSPTAATFTYDPGSPPIFSLLVSPAGTAVVTTGLDSSAHAFSIATPGNVVTITTRPAGFTGPIAQLSGSDEIVVGAVNNLHRFADAGWSQSTPSTFGGSFPQALVSTPSRFYAFSLVGGISEYTSGANGTFATMSPLAATAGGNDDAWVVGDRGQMARVSVPSANVQTNLVTGAASGDVRNLWVTDDAVLASVNGKVLQRSPTGTWTQSAAFVGPNWLAVTGLNGVPQYALDDTGALYRRQSATSSSLAFQFPTPFINFNARSAAVLPLPDGGALLGVGKVIVAMTMSGVYGLDGTLIQDMLDGGVDPFASTAPVEMVTGLALIGNRLAVTGNDPSTDGGNWRPSAHLRQDDGGWLTVDVSAVADEQLDVSACPGGSFVVAGWGGVATRVFLDGGTQELVRAPANFDSVWCGPNDEAWLQASNGSVIRIATDAGITREATGWGLSNLNGDTSLYGCAIRGNSTTVFVSGSGGSILSSPICP